MLNSLPNPTREVTISVPISKVKSAIDNIPLKVPRIKMQERSDMMNTFKMHITETDLISKLSVDMGQSLIVILNSVSESHTKVTIEVSRNIGTINQPHEMNRATATIDYFLKLLEQSISGTLLAESEQDQSVLKAQKDDQLTKTLVTIFLVIVVCFVYMMFINKK